MSMSPPCKDCGNRIPPSANFCPHCGRPGLFPNVRAAENPVEQSILEIRYEEAIDDSSLRGSYDVVKDFEKAISTSKAVIGRPAHELLRLATSEFELYSTYYKLGDAEVRLPVGDKWDPLRRVADAAFFPGYEKEIRFAALSLDGVAPSNYGAGSIVRRTNMIAHRASVLEENSVLFVDHHDIQMKDAHNLPPGYRATWDERAKLCVAKLSRRIDAATKADKYSEILLQQGATLTEDDFIEVHIWGPMTVRTIEEVSISPRAKAADRVKIRAAKEDFERFGVTMK